MSIRPLVPVLVLMVGFGLARVSNAEPPVVLDASNLESLVPEGKEIDAIYGDHLLRSDRLVAVIAEAKPARNANLTIRRVGGALIDFTERGRQSDQLGCYFPHGGSYDITGPVDWPEGMPSTEGSSKLAFKLSQPEDSNKQLSPFDLTVGYELKPGADYLTIYSLVKNLTEEMQYLPANSDTLSDGIRADGEFKFGVNQQLRTWWCEDEYWRQAYGVTIVGNMRRDWIVIDREVRKREPRQIFYKVNKLLGLPVGGQFVFERRLYSAKDSISLFAKIATDNEIPTASLILNVTDPKGPVSGARVVARRGFSSRKMPGPNDHLSRGMTNEQGEIVVQLPIIENELTPPMQYQFEIESMGRKTMIPYREFKAGTETTLEAKLSPLGRVTGTVTDGNSKPIPCRVALIGQNVNDPNFGPDSAIHGVRNLWHTADGKFDVSVLPGEYRMVISYGPEYDAVNKVIEVKAQETTEVVESLVRSVDTTGWISAELHSHSSPSGDNTSSQRGRVLNLLVDHLEFIPCTEHQRIDSYEPHLKHFGAMNRVQTCTGMELTGSPLPINHQNVFPLVERLHTQNGGGPTKDVNPEVQIERIAMWDSGSDKVVQINHPNIGQMVGDRDLDGKPDQGFRKMFGFADVMEVHPPAAIFEELSVTTGGKFNSGNCIKNWLQLLNIGYRVPGVVNTDAHWNYYGSGWLRNYIRCETDDPSQAELMEVCHALERGQSTMTNGPFLEVEAMAGDRKAGPGDDLTAEKDSLKLKVRVQCANWLDVNRVQIVVNGQLVPELNLTRARGDAGFANGVVKFEREIAVPLTEDAHVIVVTAAEGRQLGVVYGPEQGLEMPIAVSNPIFVDVDGNGFKPNGDTLGIPLPVEKDHVPTHGHDHPHPHR